MVYRIVVTLLIFSQTLFLNAQYGNSPETGQAIYYADYLNGQSTALGEVYHMDRMTCAHKTHPLGTLLRVTRLDNNRTVTVRVNDRGPYCSGCIVDLSYAAAEQLDMIKTGRARVQLEVIGHSQTNPVNKAKDPNKYQALKSPSYYSQSAPSSYGNTGNLQAKGTANSAIANPNDVNWLAPNARGYIIQVGSYTDISNASRHVIQLQKKGLEGVYLKEDRGHDGRRLNRVVIGTFTDYGRAQSYLDGLKQSYYTDGVIIQLK